MKLLAAFVIGWFYALAVVAIIQVFSIPSSITGEILVGLAVGLIGRSLFNHVEKSL